jgi:hypothetical protein
MLVPFILFIFILIGSFLPSLTHAQPRELQTLTDNVLVLTGRSGLSSPHDHFASPNNYLNGQGYGLDLHFYCHKKYGEKATHTLKNPRKASSWKCEYPSGKKRLFGGRAIVEAGIDMNEACHLQYGPFADAKLPNEEDAKSWYCHLPQQWKKPSPLHAFTPDFNWFCRKLGWEQATVFVKKGIPQAQWFCIRTNKRKTPAPVDVKQVCSRQFGPSALAKQAQFRDPHSWYCAIVEVESNASP